jgi:hypothetical protein
VGPRFGNKYGGVLEAIIPTRKIEIQVDPVGFIVGKGDSNYWITKKRTL